MSAEKNSMGNMKAQIWFTDFDSLEFAPALIDVAMTRMRWPGARSKMLSASQSAPVLRGYHQQCSLNREEMGAWSVIAGVYLVERTSFLLHRRIQRGETQEAERLRGVLMHLSGQAIEMGDSILQASGIVPD